MESQGYVMVAKQFTFHIDINTRKKLHFTSVSFLMKQILTVFISQFSFRIESWGDTDIVSVHHSELN